MSPEPFSHAEAPVFAMVSSFSPSFRLVPCAAISAFKNGLLWGEMWGTGVRLSGPTY